MPAQGSTHTALVEGAHIEAWQRLLRANCVFMRELDSELQVQHGMTVSDYDVLVQLRDAEQRSLTMGVLSERTMLTRSGMTRLVQGLEADGLVERRPCPSDARRSFAVLTPLGQERLEAARCTHHAGIRRVFAQHFTPEEAEQLSELLGQIPNVADGQGACPSGGS